MGLPGKNADIKQVPIVYPGKTFADIAENSAQGAIEDLASRGILNGVNDTSFAPDQTMTRAQFAAVTVRALGLTPKSNAVFSDVGAASWYAPYVGTANTYGIVNGTSADTFSPEATITREQATVMVSRAAKLCGMDTNLENAEILDVLSQFGDYPTSSAWARQSLAFCYQNGILSPSVLDIQPKEAVTRGEVAAMVDQMLRKADLL